MLFDRSRLVSCAVLVTAGLALAQEDRPAAPEEVLARGTQLHVTRDRALGVVAVEVAAAGRPARARVSVSAGPFSFVAVLKAGDTVSLGGTALEVVSLDPPRSLRLRRRTAGAETDPLHTAPPPVEGRLKLRATGIYTLPDGGAIGVGNVRPDGPDGQPVVTLTVFPAGFREDPTRGYDLHVDTAAGAALDGAAAHVRVHAVESGPGPEVGPDGRGVVELELTPPR